LYRSDTHIIVTCKGTAMNGIIYLIGLVVVVVAVASFFGFR